MEVDEVEAPAEAVEALSSLGLEEVSGPQWVGQALNILSGEGKQQYSAFQLGGDQYFLGDHVYLQPADPEVPFYIARLSGMYQDAEGNMWVQVRWYYRPEELEVAVDVENDHEVFFSNEFDSHPVISVAAKVEVLGPAEYRQRRREGAHMEYVYLCGRAFVASIGEVVPLGQRRNDVAEETGRWHMDRATSGQLQLPARPGESSSAVDLGAALEARPMALIGGKMMQRGGADTAQTLTQVLLDLEERWSAAATDGQQDGGSVGSAAWDERRRGRWRARARSARTIRDVVEALAELEVALAHRLKRGIDSVDREAWRARILSLHTYPTLASAVRNFTRDVEQAMGTASGAAGARPASSTASLKRRRREPSPPPVQMPPTRRRAARETEWEDGIVLKPEQLREAETDAAAAWDAGAQHGAGAHHRRKTEIKDIHGRWSKERYEVAQAALVAILRKMGATAANGAVLRPTLREEARKAIGDTGLLDHLLKHMADREVTAGGDRLLRRHNREGHMEYWLQSADAAAAEREMLAQEAAGMSMELRQVKEMRSLLATTREEAAQALRALHTAASAPADGTAGSTPSPTTSLEKRMNEAEAAQQKEVEGVRAEGAGVVRLLLARGKEAREAAEARCAALEQKVALLAEETRGRQEALACACMENMALRKEVAQQQQAVRRLQADLAAMQPVVLALQASMLGRGVQLQAPFHPSPAPFPVSLPLSLPPSRPSNTAAAALKAEADGAPSTSIAAPQQSTSERTATKTASGGLAQQRGLAQTSSAKAAGARASTGPATTDGQRLLPAPAASAAALRCTSMPVQFVLPQARSQPMVKSSGWTAPALTYPPASAASLAATQAPAVVGGLPVAGGMAPLTPTLADESQLPALLRMMGDQSRLAAAAADAPAPMQPFGSPLEGSASDLMTLSAAAAAASSGVPHMNHLGNGVNEGSAAKSANVAAAAAAAAAPAAPVRIITPSGDVQGQPTKPMSSSPSPDAALSASPSSLEAVASDAATGAAAVLNGSRAAAPASAESQNNST